MNWQKFGREFCVSVCYHQHARTIERKTMSSFLKYIQLLFQCIQRQNFRPDELRMAKIQWYLSTMLCVRSYHHLIHSSFESANCGQFCFCCTRLSQRFMNKSQVGSPWPVRRFVELSIEARKFFR